MPRNSSGLYTLPPGTDGVPNATISSSAYNTFIHDLETDANTPRPVVAGGTGASGTDGPAGPTGALANLTAEKNNQNVTNYDTQSWISGSFSSVINTPNAPNATQAFSGIVYVEDTATGQNVTVEARSRDGLVGGQIGTVYVKQKKSGTWTAWSVQEPVPTGGRLSVVSTSQLKFAPFNGNKIKINGAIYDIPTAGIAGLTNGAILVDGVVTNLAANGGIGGRYIVTAKNVGGVIWADYMSGGFHMTDTTPGNVGVEVYSVDGTTPDPTRTVIGLIRTDSNTPGRFVDSNTQRFVLNWFNRRLRPLVGASTAGNATASGSYVELSTGARIEFMVWGDNPAGQFGVNGQVANNTTGIYSRFNLGFNGTSFPLNTTDVLAYSTTANIFASGALHQAYTLPAEGYHYATLIAYVGGGTSTNYLWATGLILG